MKLGSRIRLLNATTEYPIWGILLVMGLVLLSPFVSTYLCYPAFLVCFYRIVRYDAKVFVTDYAIMAPAMQFYKITGGISFVIWLCLIAAVWYFIRNKIRVNGALVCIILLLNYLLARMQMDINRFVLCFGQMLTLYVLLPHQNAKSAERTLKAFCWSLVLTSVYALVFRNTSQIVAIRGPESYAIWGTKIMRFSGLIKDPNYYMTLLLVGMAALCKLKEAGCTGKAEFWILIATMTAFGVISYSKTFFLVFILLGGLYVIWQFWNKKVYRGMLFTAVAILFMMYMFFAENSPFAVVIERLTSGETISDMTTNRSDLLVVYGKAVVENIQVFLLGRGLASDPLNGRGAHNLIMEMLFFVGAVGFLLIVIFYVCMVKVIFKESPETKKQHWIAKYIVLLITIVAYLALQGLFEMLTYAVLFLSLMSMYIVPKRKVP